MPHKNQIPPRLEILREMPELSRKPNGDVFNVETDEVICG